MKFMSDINFMLLIIFCLHVKRMRSLFFGVPFVEVLLVNGKREKDMKRKESLL